jgi:hypothetical protein
MELSHQDDVSTQMQKMLEATNEIVRLTQDLIQAGKVLNDAKGYYREIQARIKAQKEIINSCKVVIRAENQYGS